jgi:chromosome segregation ATPase
VSEYCKLCESYAREIANLEAKLAEKRQDCVALDKAWNNLNNQLSVKDDEIRELKQQLANQENTITNLIEDNRASQEWYKKQLEEKEKEVECLRTRQFIDMTEKEMLELKIATHNEDLKKIKHIFNQDKISFAVEQLEFAQKYIQQYVNNFDDMNDCLYAIDNQIKQLRGEQ